jgi:hypothetical protein
LLEGLDEGGPWLGRTPAAHDSIATAALLALPFADDAEAAYRRLGEILGQIEPAESAPVVMAIAAIARRPLLQREAIDPPGIRSCASALLVLARRTNLANELRAPAISALRLLAERHAIDSAAIPTDLDPK